MKLAVCVMTTARRIKILSARKMEQHMTMNACTNWTSAREWIIIPCIILAAVRVRPYFYENEPYTANKVIWYYQLSWWRKLATVNSFKADVLSWRWANARNVSFETLKGGQFRLSTQLVTPNYPDIFYHRRSTTVSLETYPFYSLTSKKRYKQA